MKPKNFPARKAARRLKATGQVDPGAIAVERAKRTKKNRSSMARIVLK